MLKWTGIPVSIGVSSTKTLAKIANRVAKKDASKNGVFDMTNAAMQDDILQTVPVEDVWGVGRQYARKLASASIRTAKERKVCPRPLDTANYDGNRAANGV